MRPHISIPLLALSAALLVGSCSASEEIALGQGSTLKADNRTATPSPDNSSVIFQVDTGNLFSAFQDSSGQLWQADFNYLGGNTEGTTDPIANASQSDAQMLSTNRVGPYFLYNFGPINRLLPNTAYNVTLFFNEIYWSAPGARLFSISANNHTIAINYDIFREAGGRDAACSLTFTVTTGPLAQLELQFAGVRDNAALAGIQVSGSAAPSFQIQSFLQKDNPSLELGSKRAGKLLVRIDAGRYIKAGNYTAGNGDVWVYDRLYQGGGTESFNYVIKNATDPDSTLYDTNRVGGAFQYGFTPAQGIQPGADYTVVLRAADLYWSYTGQRIFSVSANGVPVLTNYDVIAEAGGPRAAAIAVFPVTADSTGAIALTWTASKDQAIVGGLELYEAGNPAAAAPAVAPAAAPASSPESATSAAAAPAYAPLAYRATDLQAAAPAYQPSAAALAVGPAPAAAPAYGRAYAPNPAYGGSYGGYGYGGHGYGGYGYSPSTPGSYGGYGTSYGGYGYSPGNPRSYGGYGTGF